MPSFNPFMGGAMPGMGMMNQGRMPQLPMYGGMGGGMGMPMMPSMGGGSSFANRTMGMPMYGPMGGMGGGMGGMMPQRMPAWNPQPGQRDGSVMPGGGGWNNPDRPGPVGGGNKSPLNDNLGELTSYPWSFGGGGPQTMDAPDYVNGKYMPRGSPERMWNDIRTKLGSGKWTESDPMKDLMEDQQYQGFQSQIKSLTDQITAAGGNPSMGVATNTASINGATPEPSPLFKLMQQKQDQESAMNEYLKGLGYSQKTIGIPNGFAAPRQAWGKNQGGWTPEQETQYKGMFDMMSQMMPFMGGGRGMGGPFGGGMGGFGGGMGGPMGPFRRGRGQPLPYDPRDYAGQGGYMYGANPPPTNWKPGGGEPPTAPTQNIHADNFTAMPPPDQTLRYQ